MSGRLAILYEHPEWFNLLFAELDRRGISFERWRADALLIDPESPAFPGLVVNRMSPSAWRRGNTHGIFAVSELLGHLDRQRVDVVNGLAAYEVEISKAAQLDLFRKCGVAYPRARVINHPALASRAAEGLTFPVVVKPNIGGSGAGIQRFNSIAELEIAAPTLDLGVDHTALVQEFLPARGDSIVRVEVLNGQFLYAIRIWPDFSSFNLCPADICQTIPAHPLADMSVCPVETPAKKQLRIECENPPVEAINGALALARAAHLDVGGIEYLVDDRTGRICYYDINALSNFVTDAINVVGFDPTARFVDFLERRLAALGRVHS